MLFIYPPIQIWQLTRWIYQMKAVVGSKKNSYVVIMISKLFVLAPMTYVFENF
jgi:hypothetical protein